MITRSNPAGVSIAILAGAWVLCAQEFDQLAKLFDYDKSAPLNFQIDAREPAEAAEILSVSYAGAIAPVSASLVLPAQRGKHPAVIFMSDSGHKRDQFLAEALLLAEARPPAVSLLIDAPPARPVGWRRSFNPTLENNDRDIHIQAVIDARRAVDLLTARDDVDPTRIAYEGPGDAANWGAILRRIEPRLRAFVLIAGYPNLTSAMIDDDPELADLRFALGKERFDSYVSSLSALDPVRYLGANGAPILFQFGRFDPYIARARADRLILAASDAGHAIFYNSGHDVNDPKALFDRGDFLMKRVGIGRIKLKRAYR